MRRIRFALLRKSGYASPYTLGMVYPAYRMRRLHQGAKGLWVAPILMQLPFGSRRWFRVWPSVIRLPSWIARKVKNCDADGFVKH